MYQSLNYEKHEGNLNALSESQSEKARYFMIPIYVIQEKKNLWRQ